MPERGARTFTPTRKVRASGAPKSQAWSEHIGRYVSDEQRREPGLHDAWSASWGGTRDARPAGGIASAGHYRWALYCRAMAPNRKTILIVHAAEETRERLACTPEARLPGPPRRLRRGPARWSARTSMSSSPMPSCPASAASNCCTSSARITRWPRSSSWPRLRPRRRRAGDQTRRLPLPQQATEPDTLRATVAHASERQD